MTLYDQLNTHDIYFPFRNEYDIFIESIAPDERQYCAIGGSSVLNALGYINRPSADLDISLSDKCISGIEFVQRFHMANNTTSYYPQLDGIARYSLYITGVKCCIFILPHKRFMTSVYEDTRYSMTIVKPSFIYKIKQQFLNKNLDKFSREKHENDLTSIERYAGKLACHKKLINYLDIIDSL